MIPSSGTDRRSPFERHPWLTIAFLLFGAVVGTDFIFTAVYGWMRPEFYRDRSGFRIRSEIYHHGFKPLASVDDEA